jgi:hypothetical protein
MPPDIAARRLHTQRLTGEPFASPVDAVAWLTAVQAQDYTGAKWALGMRTRKATDADIDRLYDAGAILRTHVMRPTWHFVLPKDLRWLMNLSAPRVKAKTATYDRRLEIDAALLRVSHAAIESALAGGRHLTRPELAATLAEAGIVTDVQRMGHLLMHAELDQVVVSGPRRGNRMTYALFEERVPAMPSTRRLDRDEALAELTLRYFTGHGPAQLQDFAWWSGLTIADGRRGIEAAGPALEREVIGGRSFWSSPAAPAVRRRGRAPIVHLLPNYDEYLVAYRDRSDSLDPARQLGTAPFPHGSILAHAVVLNGQVWGGWKRRLSARPLVVELGPIDPLDDSESRALLRAADDLARFAGVPVTVTGLARAEAPRD